MFTAKDMHNKLKMLDHCEDIDNWIEETLYAKFIQYGHPAIVDTSEVTRQGWNKNGFCRAMANRGFSLDYKSDQRDGDYYRITYPPQEI